MCAIDWETEIDFGFKKKRLAQRERESEVSFSMNDEKTLDSPLES